MVLINFNIISLFSFFSSAKSFSLIISNVLENNVLLIIGLLLILLLVVIVAYSVTISKLKISRTALHESKERANKLANLTFEGIVIHDSGILIDSNESFLKMFGYISEELKNKDIVKLLIHPDDFKIVEEKVRDKVTKPYEVRGVKKNGEIIPLEIESREIELDGKPVRVAALRDITERKKQEELIKKEQWLLSTMMNNIPDSIYFKDLDSKFIRVNKNTVEKFNLQSADQIIGKSDFDIFDEEHARTAYEDEQRIIKTGKPIINKIEKESWKDGKIGWASTSKMPLYDSAGNIIGTFGLTRDITDLKNAQDNLKAEKEKFEQLLSLVPSAVFTVDLEQRITSWNMMAERLTGYKADEIIGQKCTLTNQRPCTDSCGLFSNEVEKPKVDAECSVRRKDGTLITVSKNVDLLRDESGKVIGGIESFIDISERKRFEEQIKNMNEALEETNKSKDRFFSIIAHDLRNPFVTLLGFSEMLIEDFNDFSDEEKITYLKEMQKTAQSSHELLDNLLQWSRSQTGRIKYSPSKINFSELLNENYELVQKTADMKNIELKSKVDDNLFLQADEDMVTTILRNLLTNALKFTQKDGKITVSAQSEDSNFVHISIADTGIGIEPERVDKIFLIDETESTEGTSGEKGSGLGLILSKEFVEKHGGRIWVESKIGEGTTFHFTLPKS